jgi:predicted nucleotidyltransferase
VDEFTLRVAQEFRDRLRAALGGALRGVSVFGSRARGEAREDTDVGLLTCRQDICEDLVDLFHYLTGRSLKRQYKRLLVAPVNMKDRFLEMIERETANRKAGRPARIVAKMNSLEDRGIVRALYRANQAGVAIDLNIFDGGQTAGKIRQAAAELEQVKAMLRKATLGIGLEVEQAQRVGDRGAGSADASGYVVLAQPELVGQLPVGMGFLDGIEVGALKVLHQRDFQHLLRRSLFDDDRHRGKPGQLRRAPAPLARDQLVTAGALRDDERLNQPVLAD